MDDSGFLRTPDKLLESFGTRAHRSEVFETMMGACGPLNSGGSATVANSSFSDVALVMLEMFEVVATSFFYVAVHTFRLLH